jgi:hypothetical protein
VFVRLIRLLKVKALAYLVQQGQLPIAFPTGTAHDEVQAQRQSLLKGEWTILFQGHQSRGFFTHHHATISLIGFRRFDWVYPLAHANHRRKRDESGDGGAVPLVGESKQELVTHDAALLAIRFSLPCVFSSRQRGNSLQAGLSLTPHTPAPRAL